MSRGIRNDPVIEPTEMDKSYAAGFMDGEGSITIAAPNNQRGWYPKVQISQVDPAPLVWLQQRWGGSLHAVRRTYLREKHGQKASDIWLWQVSTQMCVRFLDDLLPFLRVKKPAAENALLLRNLPRLGGGSLGDDEIEWRQMIAEEAKRLNAKGDYRHSPEV